VVHLKLLRPKLEPQTFDTGKNKVKQTQHSHLVWLTAANTDTNNYHTHLFKLYVHRQNTKPATEFGNGW